MDIARKLKVGFDRVLTGRVAKAPKSPNHARASSQSRKSSMARRGSVSFEDAIQTLIKQEDERDPAFASAPRAPAINMNIEPAPEARQSTNSCRGQPDEKNDGSDDKMTIEDTQNDSRDEWDVTTSLSPGNRSEEPIPSIEADEEDFPPPKPRALPYLHGAAKSKKNVKSLRVDYLNEDPGEEDADQDQDQEQEQEERQDEDDQGQVEVDIDYDELEESLMEESEEDLLIAEENLHDYIKHKLTIEEIDTWPKEAARLYKLLYLRGLYPLMRNGWTWDFFGHPMPDGIFTPKGSDDKTLIKAYGNQFHGEPASVWTNGRTQTDLFLAARAVRDLFNLYSRIRGLRQTGHTDQIGPIIKKEINVYLRWATKDAGLRRIGYEIGFAWPVFVLDFSSAHNAERIVRACRSCVQKYKAKWAGLGIVDYPRLITVFAIIQHTVVVLVVDADDDETQDPMPMTEIDVSELNHWLDTAIAIAIPIMLARESLLVYRDSFPVTEREESDPDL